MNGIKLLVFVLKKGLGESLLKLCGEENIRFRMLLKGRGTADSEILRILGMGPEKDVVLVSAEDTRSDALMEKLGTRLGLDRPGEGIAFSIPLSALVSRGDQYALMAGAADPGEQRKQAGTQNKRLCRKEGSI